MINKEQRIELRKILGYHYAHDVLKILKRDGVTSRKGTPYGTSMIRNVYNGLNENKKIENAIMKLCMQRQEEKEKEIQRKNTILGILPKSDTKKNT
jgi:hypothetical protein